MGSLIDLDARRRQLRPAPARPAETGAARTVTCFYCGETHPIVRLPGGQERCVTAFFDSLNWFCRNRGCRRAWMESLVKP